MTGVIASYAQTRAPRRRSLLAAALTAFALAACQAPPTADRLKSDIATAITEATPAGLIAPDAITIIAVNRQPRRALVYFSADLRLTRDHTFGSWDQVSVAALTHALGAAPQAIDGIHSQGNARGDILHINSRVLYVADSQEPGWRLEHFGPAPQPTPAFRPTLRNEAWNVALALVAAPRTWQIIRDNFAWAFTRSHAQLARAAGGLAVASGPPGSDAWSVVEALRRSEGSNRPIVNLVPRSDADALRFVRDGTATAAIIDSDQAQTAINSIPDLRAAGALFPEQLHLIVASDSKIASVVDLRGKRVTIAGASTHAAEAALKAYRISGTSARISDAPLPEALAALADGSVDAVIAASRAPDDRIADFAAHQPIRLLGLDSDAIALLTTGENRYLAINIPARSYPNQPNPISTVAVVAMLVAPASVSEGEMTTLLTGVFSRIDYLHLGSLAGTLINRDSALHGLTLPPHPAAETFFVNPAIDSAPKAGFATSAQNLP